MSRLFLCSSCSSGPLSTTCSKSSPKDVLLFFGEFTLGSSHLVVPLVRHVASGTVPEG